MQKPVNPSEITREVLRLFATRKLQPTPENFTALYHEVAGSNAQGMQLTSGAIRSIAERLPRDNAERGRLARQVDQALATSQRADAENALSAWLDDLHQHQPPAWNTLISNLLRQWESRQLGWTTARKRESLERVLTAQDPQTLHSRLQGLIKAWSQAPTDPDAPENQTATDVFGQLRDNGSGTEAAPTPSGSQDDSTQPPPQSPSRPPPSVRLVTEGEAGELIDGLRELLLLALENLVPAFLADHPELAAQGNTLADAVRSASRVDQFRTIGKQLRKLAYRVEITLTDDAEVRNGLLKLLHLLLQNIDEIVIDDQWLHGQIEMLRDLVAQPGNPRLIDDAERRLKEVIYKQSQLKHSLAEAQRNLRQMLAGFVDQLASFTETTSAYHDRIAENAGKIAEARDITEIGHLLDAVMHDTREIQEEARRSRDELQAARDQARQAEQRIEQLQKELDETSRQMRHDQLTGVLNRRGLEETFHAEATRAQRRGTSLCVALLDIDNFKRLNDTYGHQTGDDALVHLTRVVRENLRPHDTVARLGGEEFIILYPESGLEEATIALVRLQRELTKTFFLADDSKILITFSAGVSPWRPDEPMDAVIKRADEAMYEAKQTGKNKVVARNAPPQERSPVDAI